MKRVHFARVRCCVKGRERRRAGAKPEIYMGKGFRLHVNWQNKKVESFPKSWLETNFSCCWCWKSDPCCPKWVSKFFKAHSRVCCSCRRIAGGGREGGRELGCLERLNVIAGVPEWLTPWLEQERDNTRTKHSVVDDVPSNISGHWLVYSFHYIISEYRVLSSNGAFCFCDFLLLRSRPCEAQRAASCILVTCGPSALLGRIQQCFFTKLSLHKPFHL